MTTRALLFLLPFGAFACTAQGSSSVESGSAAIHAAFEPFAGFDFDSGALPATSPVQLQVKAHAAGKITLDADGPGAGAGRFAIDAGIDLATTIISTLPGASYEGPIKGVPALNIAIKGATVFDPMVKDGMSKLVADVSPSSLITVPLATALGVPAVTGDVVLELKGGTVESTFIAGCAEGGRYSGTLRTGGQVTLGGKLVTEVPLLGSKTFDLPEIEMAIPSTESVLNFVTPDDAAGTGCAITAAPAAPEPSPDPTPEPPTPAPSPTAPPPSTPDPTPPPPSSSAPPPGQLWDIIIDTATIGDRSDGSGWDTFSAADPYVWVTVGQKSFSTSTKTDVRGTVTFYENIGAVTTAELQANGFSMTIYDYDTISYDEVIGSFTSTAIFDGAAHDRSCGTAGPASVRFAFVPRPL